MEIIQNDFSGAMEEEIDFQFQAMIVIKDDNRARMFLALLSSHQKHWIKSKITSI